MEKEKTFLSILFPPPIIPLILNKYLFFSPFKLENAENCIIYLFYVVLIRNNKVLILDTACNTK